MGEGSSLLTPYNSMTMNRLDRRLIEVTSRPGHIVLRSGQHAFEKIECDELQKHAILRKKIYRKLGKLAAEVPALDGIVTIANGANVFAQPVAAITSRILGKLIDPIETEKNDLNEFSLLGDVEGKSIVVLDDVYSHGTNIQQVAEIAHDAGACVLGAVVIVNRNPLGDNVIEANGSQITVRSIVEYPIIDYAPQQCPLYTCNP